VIKILKPKNGYLNPTSTYGTFRELLELWEENGFCSTGESPDDFCWVGEHGDILLYDWPRIDDRNITKFNFGLFGNTVPLHEKVSPWIFWARRPRKLEQARNSGIKSYKDRHINSIFLGKIENPIQEYNRTQHDWSKYIEFFNCNKGEAGENNYKYTQEEYLEKIGSSKFGLCLPGYGPKCNREIELLGMGVVPIFTQGVDYTYYKPLIENVHFIKAESPEEIEFKIKNITEEQWQVLHNNGQDWFKKNCSTKGSFDTTLEIINKVRGVSE